MRSKLFVVFLLGLLAAMPAFSQVSITGQIRGTVLDPTGAAVPDVKLTANSPALLSPRTTTSQKDGSYLFDELPPGTYQISASATGFKSITQGNIVITPHFTATINPRLTMGQVSETVEVKDEAPVVDVQGTETTANFDTGLLQNIPSGRDIWSTVAQAPGTTLSNFDVGGNQSFQQAVMEVHGSQPGEQVYSFNGLRLNWPGSTGGFTSFYIDHDSLQQFQVISDNAPAEVGVGGVYMNMIPKSGSNSLHGLAAIYYASAGMEAGVEQPIFNGVPVAAGAPIIQERDTTANLGGPVIKDRWWLFGSWRLYNVKESILSVRRQDGTPISDPNHQTNATLRSDWQLTKNNRLNFVWWFNEQNRFFRRDTAFAFVNEEASWRQIEPAYVLQGQWTSVIHNLVLDTRMGYMHQIFPLGYQTSVATTDFNRQDIGFSTETGAAPYQFVNPAEVYAFATSASYYKGNFFGSHNFKFGFDTSTNRNGYDYTVFQGINAIYNSGVPIEVAAFNTPLKQRSIFHETSGYGQDAWTIARRLTVNVGLRFTHFRTFTPPQTSPAATFPDLFPTRTFAQSKDFVDWNTWDPRFGVAYDLRGNGKSVIRASFSKFDVVEGTELAEALNQNGFSGSYFTWKDTNADGIPQTAEWNNPANLLFSFGGVFTRVAPNLKRPYSMEVNAGYEQQVFQDLRLGVNYYYRSTKRLYAQQNAALTASDYTPVQATNPLTGQPITLYNLDPTKTTLSDFVVTNIPDLDSNAYHAVEITGVKRLTHRWQLLAGLTFQRKKGTYRRGLGDNFTDPNQNIFRNNAILDYDAPRVFKLDSTFDLPLHVSFSTNFQHYTGYPLDPNLGPPHATFTDANGVPLNQGPETVLIESPGKTRLPNVNILNLRLSRPTKLTERINLEPLVDLFNVTNAHTVTQKVSAFSSDYLKPTDQMLNPFIARFGLKLTF